MSSHDDADPDDEALSGLRSVWLSMPDEEPPARGLAELMAAARVKADEMAEAHAEAHPSWWQRFLATLRRPQVLALATILILVGGAVFIGARRDKLEAPSPTVARESEPARDEKMQEELAPAEAAGSAAPPAPVTAEPTTTGAATAPAPETARDITAEPAPLPKADGAPASTPRSHGASKTAGPSKAKATMKPRKDSSDALAVGGAFAADEAAEAPAPTAKELYAQARAAAAKGDCATVKRLAKQIARLDAPFYRASVATDQTLATCLN